MNLHYFSHLRLSRFNLLTVQGTFAERLPRRFIIFQIHKILHSLR